MTKRDFYVKQPLDMTKVETQLRTHPRIEAVWRVKKQSQRKGTERQK